MFLLVLELTHAEVNVTVVVVFTKCDILFNECYRKASKAAKRGKPTDADIICNDAETRARDFLKTSVDNFPELTGIRYVTVSTQDSKQYPIQSDTYYQHLTSLLTRPAL